MILRAIFWIGLVAILMPHEPDLGFGRPGQIGIAPVTTELASWAKTKVAPDVSDPERVCRYNVHACATGLTLLDSFQSIAVRGLSEVKADIEHNGRTHTPATSG